MGKKALDEEEEAGRLEAGESSAAAGGNESEEEEDEVQEPKTLDEWIKAQQRLFSGLSRLPKGWIRLRSKSTGLIYFYNVTSGQSSPTEPKGTVTSDEPKTIDDWAAAQKKLFPGLPKLPPG